VRKDIDVNEHERLSNITLRHKVNVKEQLVVRKLTNLSKLQWYREDTYTFYIYNT
jgi:hypothetical protein